LPTFLLAAAEEGGYSLEVSLSVRLTIADFEGRNFQ